jgi:hypothetical protein
MNLTELAQDLATRIEHAQDNKAREQIIHDWLLAQQEKIVEMYEQQNTVQIVVNQAAPGNLAVGDYVFASRWSDCDPSDPWVVGHISEVGSNFVVVGEVSPRYWPKAMKISAEQGQHIIEQYPHMEGNRDSLNYKKIAQVFGIDVV